MLPTDPKHENLNECWKKQINEYFNEISLTSDKKRTLEHMLLKASANNKSALLRNRYCHIFGKLNNIFVINQNKILSHVVTAALAAILTFSLTSLFEFSNHDFISEMVISMQNSNAMPPDFDLVGDSTALQQLSIDSLPNQSFEPVIPKQLAQNYSAYEGRFFLYKGQQGVSITMEPNQSIVKAPPKHQRSHNAVLYIVKLSRKSESSFPKQKILKKIQSSSKIKRIYAWREGSYGYAMVQLQNFPENQNANIFDSSLLNEDQLNMISN